MKKLFLSGLIWMVAICAAARTTNVDSLINVLETQKLTADRQISIYRSLTDYYSDRNPKESLLYAKKGLKIAEKQKSRKDIQWFASHVGGRYEQIGILDTAMIYLDKAIVYANDDYDKAWIYGSMGNIQYQQNNLTSSLEYFLKAKTIADETGDKLLQLNALTSIAGINRTLYNLDKALQYYEQAKLIAEELNDSISLCFIYYGMGNVFSDRNDYGNVIEYENKLIDMSKIVGIERYEALAKSALARLYCSNAYKDLDKALEYADRAAFIFEEIGIPRLIASSKELQARVYVHQGRLEEAGVLAIRALETDTAEQSITKRNLLEMLIEINIYLGNKETAIDYLTEYGKFINTYNEKSFHETMVDMEVRYETEKKEIRIAALEKERLLYVWLGIAGGVLVIAMSVVLWQKIRNARKEKQLIATRSILDGEMKERTRLAHDLHDRLSGNLSAVKIELAKHAETLQTVRDQLDKCIRDIRDAAHDLMPASLQYGMKVALEDFAKQFSNVHFHFFGNENRIGERLEYVVYCCANELVHNAVKHSGAQNINLQLIQDKKRVALTVSDDGCGFDEKNVTTGLGLKSIRNRVESCNGKIDVAALPGKGTETTIELRIEN